VPFGLNAISEAFCRPSAIRSTLRLRPSAVFTTVVPNVELDTRAADMKTRNGAERALSRTPPEAVTNDASSSV
jgi:hypothetical protein